MRKILVLLSLLFAMLTIYAQKDEVYPASGEKPYLNCQILKVTNDNIITFIYQEQEYILQAISIKRNGQYFDLSEFVSDGKSKLISSEMAQNSGLKEEGNMPTIDRRYSYSAIGIGLGNAYGGMGFQFQFRDGKAFGFGGHLGAGIIPRIGEMSKISFGFSAGVKVFVYKPIYLDLTYGVVGAYEYGILLGPSLLGGANLFFGKKLGLNFAGGLSYYQREFAPTLDFGLLIKLPGRK